ncbi:MAG: acetylglutamate kinase [Bacteroidetes bacterium HGW-Bacteroidetes-11]|jgi:acetylglutamate kinase|nr:MAG: acetylglutamate kinase [Bacteroidetes bacterium HGW-Bacteroidetes-11]
MSQKPILLFKYGGNAMTDSNVKHSVLANIVSLKKQGYDVVISHGGGPFIKEMLASVNLKSAFIDGLRYTTPEALKYIEMVLKGQVNSDLVTTINGMGYSAVGISGKDGKTVVAQKKLHKRGVNGVFEEVDLGLVGDVSQVNPELINLLLENGYIPLIACIAADEKGVGYNINGDTFAGYLAGALQAEQFVILTDVDGLLKDKDDPASIIRKISLSELQVLKNDGTIQGGMIPKMEACETAINNGARSAKIINGTQPGQIGEINNALIGTLITKH